jgi:trypsin
MKAMFSVSVKLLIASRFLVTSNASLRGGRDLSLFAEGFASASAEDEPEESDRTETRIIGGSTASKGRYSYAVSLQDGIGHFCGKIFFSLASCFANAMIISVVCGLICLSPSLLFASGGSLIASDVVLTAAHCQGGKYDVVIARHDLGAGDGESIAMDYEISHPKYNDKTTDNDFNLVFLSRPTKEKVSLVNINNDSNSPRVGEEVIVMGWGDTTSDDYTQKLADKLMDVSVNVISNQDCDDSEGSINGWNEDYHNQISDKMMCAKDSGEDACQGDSGK